ncbi:unnamed protein product [Cylicocyclus nassatus]|uniref:Calponin-homology (CH) domain-containing protein n=1 Tax=Cylicocyclus nassatus TaxID=53992 RepID=A0AA36DPD9_CYLNA|nr:unnamed protein product [Cylicocyclus nassatus]
MATGWKRFTGSSPYPELATSDNGTESCYGSKQDRSYRIPWLQGKHSRNEEVQMLDWVAAVTGYEISRDPDSAMKQLSDGKILCRLIQRLTNGELCQTINEKPSMFSAGENISKFFDSLEYIGISGLVHISPNQLQEERNLDGLVSLLKELYRRAH